MALADSPWRFYANESASGAQTTTVTSTTSPLRACECGDVVSVARPILAGRTIIVQADVRGDGGRLVVQATRVRPSSPDKPDPFRAARVHPRHSS